MKNLTATLLASGALLCPTYSVEQFAKDITRSENAGEVFDHGLEVAAVYGVRLGYEEEKPYPFSEGIAYISVRGSLINRSMASYSFMTGYKAILGKLDFAMQDADVRGIVFDVDSYGGEAAGCFELCAAILAYRGIKPMLAVVDSAACSAGFAVAACADRVSMIPSGTVGSVGVITEHTDYSGLMAQAGVKKTLLYRGSHKADGNPYEPLPAEVAALINTRLEERYAAFTDLVDQARGLTAGAARATEARTYGATEALALGLIDAIAPAPQALLEFCDSLNPAPAGIQMEAVMADTTQAAGVAEARTAERARVSAILQHAEANGRGDLASHLAFETDMTPDQAAAMLSKAPKAVAAAAPAPVGAVADPLAAAMAAVGTPAIGQEAAGASSTAEPTEADIVKQMLGAYSQATGVKV